MLTEKTFKLIALLIKIGYWSGTFPFKWNSRTYTITIMPKFKLKLWKIYTVLLITVQWVVLLFHAIPLFALGDKIRLADRILMFRAFLFFVFALSFQVFNLRQIEDMVQVLNTVYCFTRQQGKKMHGA